MAVWKSAFEVQDSEEETIASSPPRIPDRVAPGLIAETPTLYPTLKVIHQSNRAPQRHSDLLHADSDCQSDQSAKKHTKSDAAEMSRIHHFDSLDTTMRHEQKVEEQSENRYPEDTVQKSSDCAVYEQLKIEEGDKTTVPDTTFRSLPQQSVSDVVNENNLTQTVLIKAFENSSNLEYESRYEQPQAEGHVLEQDHLSHTKQVPRNAIVSAQAPSLDATRSDKTPNNTFNRTELVPKPDLSLSQENNPLIANADVKCTGTIQSHVARNILGIQNEPVLVALREHKAFDTGLVEPSGVEMKALETRTEENRTEALGVNASPLAADYISHHTMASGIENSDDHRNCDFFKQAEKGAQSDAQLDVEAADSLYGDSGRRVGAQETSSTNATGLTKASNTHRPDQAKDLEATSSVKNVSKSALASLNSSEEAALIKLKAQKITLLTSLAALPAVQAVIGEAVTTHSGTASFDDRAFETSVTYAANKIVKQHIRLLHEYNELKDIGQGLMGLIADQRGVRTVEVQDELGIEAGD